MCLHDIGTWCTGSQGMTPAVYAATGVPYHTMRGEGYEGDFIWNTMNNASILPLYKVEIRFNN